MGIASGREDDAGAVQQGDLLVQVDLLHGGRDTWRVACRGRMLPLQAVDQGALAHVGQPHHTCSTFAPQRWPLMRLWRLRQECTQSPSSKPQPPNANVSITHSLTRVGHISPG